MTTLRSIPCTGNPMRGLRQAARGISTDALLAALRNRIAEDEQVCSFTFVFISFVHRPAIRR
jgi:hypothetical protein